jgi:hypothetical protein
MGLGSISKILGDGTAERERNFAQIFLRTQDYEDVEANLSSLILGGRGTGKSAICRMLGDSSRIGGDEVRSRESQRAS